jgi:hypothetical protein
MTLPGEDPLGQTRRFYEIYANCQGENHSSKHFDWSILDLPKLVEPMDEVGFKRREIQA